MSDCQIKTCINNYRTKESRIIHFHRFPKKSALLSEWKKACGRQDVNVKNGRICSSHFESTAYKEYQLDQLPKKRRLKHNAVPTLNLELSFNEDLDKSAIVSDTVMNTVKSKEQIEALTSRHSLNLNEQITPHSDHSNSQTPVSSMSGNLPKNFLDKSPTEIGENRPVESRENKSLEKQCVNDNNRREYEIRENEIGREQQNEKERNKISKHLYKEDQDAGSQSEQKVNTKDRFKIYECDHCDYAFLLYEMLVLHIQRVHRNRQYECSNCKKRFFILSDLHKHLYTHLKKKRFSCSICQKEFIRMSQLQRHKKIHTMANEMYYACQHCSNKFSSIEEWKKHENLEHKTMQLFQCDICYHFVYKQSLQQHMMLHEGNPFTCNYCSEIFNTKSLLNQHLLTHIGIRPHVCEVCLKTFSQQHYLNKHLKVNHSELKKTEKHHSDAQSEAQQLNVCSLPTPTQKYTQSYNFYFI